MRSMGQASEPWQVLSAVSKHSDLLNSQAPPFQMDLDFDAQLNVPVHGHMSLHWAAKDRWRSEIVMGDFKQIRVRDGEMEYTLRNLPFEPLPTRRLSSLLHFATGLGDFAVKKEKHRNDAGQATTCFSAEQKGFRVKEELCVADAAGTLLTRSSEIPPDERDRILLADYADFAGYEFPRNLVLEENGSKVVKVNVTRLAAAAFDDTLLKPPAGAIVRRQCEGKKRPIPVKTPDPTYPRAASANNLQGDVTVAMSVQPDGSVGDIYLIGRAALDMDEVTMKSLKSWRFKPAMCGTEAVADDIQVVVSFRRD